MKKYKIWRVTHINTGGKFYILKGFNEMCVVFDDNLLYIDGDFSGFKLKDGSTTGCYRDDIILNVDFTPLESDEEIDMFCMVNGVDNELKPLLKFAYQNRKEIFCENQ